MKISLTASPALTPSRGSEAGALPYEVQTLRWLGSASALLCALCSLAFAAAVVIMFLRLPPSDYSAGWTGIENYLLSYDPILLLPLYPSLLLAPAFAALMVCIHHYAAPERRLWSQLGLSFSLVYTTMAFTNYIVQLTSVQRAVQAGESDGVAMLVHGNPHSLFWALVSSYIFMNLAMLFAAPVFQGGTLETWARRLFLLNGASVLLTAASLAVDSPLLFNLGSLVIWCPLFTASAALLAVLFARLGRQNESFNPNKEGRYGGIL
jgi:hypothetical protein